MLFLFPWHFRFPPSTATEEEETPLWRWIDILSCKYCCITMSHASLVSSLAQICTKLVVWIKPEKRIGIQCVPPPTLPLLRLSCPTPVTFHSTHLSLLHLSLPFYNPLYRLTCSGGSPWVCWSQEVTLPFYQWACFIHWWWLLVSAVKQLPPV